MCTYCDSTTYLFPWFAFGQLTGTMENTSDIVTTLNNMTTDTAIHLPNIAFLCPWILKKHRADTTTIKVKMTVRKPTTIPLMTPTELAV